MLRAPGAYSVRVSDERTGSWVSREIEVPAVEAFAFDLAFAWGSIAGRVRGPDGNPLAGIDVQAYEAEGTSSGCQTVTDRDGRYTLALPAGTYQVSAGPPFGPGGSSSSLCRASTVVQVTGEGETRGIDFELRQGGTIEGTVRRADGSALGIRTWVVVLDPEDERVSFGQVSPSGSFRVNGVPPGTMRIEAMSEGWKSTRVELEVGADRTVRAELELVPASEKD